jgi:proline racemase
MLPRRGPWVHLDIADQDPGQMTIGDELINESLIGTHFIGRPIAKAKVGDFDAIIPTITGRAWITGTSQHMLAPDDPFPEGFLL